MFQQFQDTLTFDDVLLVPQHSEILPADAKLGTNLTSKIKLNLPFLSAPMDTVTEHKMAIALALAGGIGIIHKNLSVEDQVQAVKKVKRFENAFIKDPVSVGPDDSIAKVYKIRKELGYKKLPVINNDGKMVGLISDVHYLISHDKDAKVKDRMRPVDQIQTAKKGISLAEAHRTIREQHIKTLPVIDEQGRLDSIVTRSDLEKNEFFPHACKSDDGRLRVGGAVGAGPAALERAAALVEAGADVIVIDTAHGHSAGVINTVKELKNKYPQQQVIAGNIVSGEAAKALIEAGADAVKVGVGPGSICTTRVVSGVGVPQLSAVLEVVKGVRETGKDVPVIADGGLKSSGDIVKTLAAGASAVMMGKVFAGTDESPGRVDYIDGKMYKVYRGMGSLEAMERGSKDRYGQAEIEEKQKFVPEGVSGRVPYKGPVSRILYQLAGGLRSGMGYNGAETIEKLRQRAVFVKISGSSLRESHPHGLGDIESAPNYKVGE